MFQIRSRKQRQVGSLSNAKNPNKHWFFDVSLKAGCPPGRVFPCDEGARDHGIKPDMRGETLDADMQGKTRFSTSLAEPGWTLPGFSTVWQ